MKKVNYYFAILAAILWMVPAGLVLALEIKYPSLGIGAQITPRTTLLGYIKYYFIFIVLSAGIIGIASIVISGLEILLTAGNPSRMESAKERIYNAILGIILLFCSFILLQTINPSFVNFNRFSQPPGPGIYLLRRDPGGGAFNPSRSSGLASLFISTVHAQGTGEEEGREFIFAQESDEDYDEESAQGFKEFINYCPPDSQDDRVVNLYFAEDFELNSQAMTIVVPCTTNLDELLSMAGVRSYQVRPKTAGIYYFNDNHCGGFQEDGSNPGGGLTTLATLDSAAQQEDGDIPWFIDPDIPGIAPNLDQTIHSVGFMPQNLTGAIPESYDSFNWGIILSEGSSLLGECSAPIFNTTTKFLCVNLDGPDAPRTLDGEPFNPFAVHIIRQDKIPNFNPLKAGVTFWSNNKQFTLDQFGNTETDINRNIGDLWSYGLNDAGMIDVSSQNDGSLMRQGLGNIDELLRMFGKQSNNNLKPVPGDECIPFDPADPENHDSTIGDTPEARGILTCLDKVTEVGPDEYEFVFLTHNEQIKFRSCNVTNTAEIYNSKNIDPAQSMIPENWNERQINYQTYVIPVFNPQPFQ